eukprot:6487867-Amphidinium_carterae.1
MAKQFLAATLPQSTQGKASKYHRHFTCEYRTLELYNVMHTFITMCHTSAIRHNGFRTELCTR